MCSAVCSQASITVQNTPEDGAKYLNQGAPYGTKEGQEQYHRRNTIESRNDRVKSSRHQGHGDPTMRLMRGWAAQAISAVMSVVAANIGLLSAESRWRFPKKPTPPTTPPDGRKTRGRDETGTDAFPQRATACGIDRPRPPAGPQTTRTKPVAERSWASAEIRPKTAFRRRKMTPPNERSGSFLCSRPFFFGRQEVS